MISSLRQKGSSLVISSHLAAHLSLTVSALLMGSAYVGAKLALQGVGPFTTAFIRFLIACAITWPVLFLIHGIQRIRKQDVGNLIAHGLFQTTLYFGLQYFGLQFTTADNTALIVNTRPLFLALLAIFFFRERFSFWQWMALLLSFFGVVVVLYNPANAFLPNHYFGDFLIVLNALSGALGVLFGKKLLKNYKPFTILVYQITIGMLGLLPFAIFESGGHFSFGEVAWGPIIFLAIFSSAIAQTLFNSGLSKLPVSNTGVYFFIIPVVNIILAHFIFDEPVTWQLILGGLMIVIGAYFVNNRTSKIKNAERLSEA